MTTQTSFDTAASLAGGGIVNKFSPTDSAVHIDGPLTNISVAMIQSNTNFIAGQVFPEIGVSKQSDLYFTYPRGDFNRNTMERRAPATESVGDGYRLSNAPYYCPVYALHKDIPDQVRANEDVPLSSNRDATIFLTQKGLIFKEITWASQYFTAGAGWSREVAGVAGTPSGAQAKHWSDPVSTPIADIKLEKRTMMGNTGFEPNTLVLGRAVYDALTLHPEIIDRIKYGQTPGAPAMVTTQAMAALFEVSRILVMNAIQNTAGEGATAAHSFIGGNNAMLTYTAGSPGIMTPTAGLHFNWNYAAGLNAGTAITNMRMQPIKSDRLEIEMAFTSQIVADELGMLFTSIVA